MFNVCLQVYEWRLQKMEAFRIEQELSIAARLNAEHARMVREEKEKMHREKQKTKAAFTLHLTTYFCVPNMPVLMAIFTSELTW